MTMRNLLMMGVWIVAGAAAAAPVTEAGNTACEAARQYGAAVRNCDMGWAVDFMYPPLRRIYADRLAERDPSKAAEASRRMMGLSQETQEEAVARMRANDKALRAQFAQMGAQMREKGVKVESFAVGKPTAEYVVTPVSALARNVKRDSRASRSADSMTGGQDRCRLVILPTTLVMSMPEKDGRVLRVERRSYIYAIRDELITTGSTGAVLKKWYFVDGNADVNMLRSFFTNLPLNLELPVCSDRQL